MVYVLFAWLAVAGCTPPEHVERPSPAFNESSINNVWHKAKLRGVSFRAIGQEAAVGQDVETGSAIEKPLTVRLRIEGNGKNLSVVSSAGGST